MIKRDGQTERKNHAGKIVPSRIESSIPRSGVIANAGPESFSSWCDMRCRAAKTISIVACTLGFSALGCAPPVPGGPEQDLSTAESTTTPDASPPPNIVLIVADDHVASALGVGGNTEIQTPSLDRLAQDGAYFSRAYVPSRICAPSRASLLTGLYPHQHGLTRNVEPEGFRSDLLTIPEILKKRGYKCGFVGKWHLPEDDGSRDGFDDYWVSLKDRPGYENPALNVQGREVAHQGFLTDILTDYAISFVDENAKRPFFLWLAYKAPHAKKKGFPEGPANAFNYRTENISLSPGLVDDLSEKPPEQRDSPAHQNFNSTSRLELTELVRRYYGMVSRLDSNVERLMDAIAERGLDRNTLIIYLSDNGILHGQHQLLFKAPSLYEEQVRTPLILCWPGHIRPGQRIDSLVSTLDIFPTICHVAEADPPAELVGRNLWPILTDAATPWRDAVFFEGENWQGMPEGEETVVRGLIRGDYKYVYYSRFGDEELYNLRQDPEELHNLSRRTDYDDRCKSLRQLLTDWQQRTRDSARIPPESQ